MNKSKFANVLIDPDTRILLQQEAMFDDWPVLYQRWVWDGIYAESLIFLDEDVAHLDDAALERFVRESPLIREDSKITLKRGSNGYTFVNFNFES